jgi:tetratricopeptide (TPR) repeat protein
MKNNFVARRKILEVEGERMRNVKYYLACSAALATFLVYLPALQNGFTDWDDNTYVLTNPHIRSFDIAFFKWAFFHFYDCNWHPLTWISHAFDYAIWGLNPFGHHLVNIIFHAVNTFLVVILIIRFLEIYKETATKPGLRPFLTERTMLIASGATGLLFGLHPLHVESVAWVAERKDLLCALFFLLSIMMYTNYARSVSNGTDNKKPASHFFNKQYVLALGLFIFALTSKPMAVTLPVILLLLDWHPFNRMQSLKSFRALVIEKLPFIALSLISSIVTILAQRAGGSLRSMEIIPLSTRLLVAAEALIAYLWKMLWPLNLVPYYPYPKDVSLFSLKYIAAIALVIGITLACIVAAKKRKLWLSVWGYYVVTLIPVLGIVQVGGQSMAERYTYLPSLGPFLVIGLASAWISKKTDAGKKWGLIAKVIWISAVICALGSISYRTVEQIGIWKNGITLWDYVIEKEPEGVSIAYTNRGLEFEKIGQLDKAIEDYSKAIVLDPSAYIAYFNLGVVYFKTDLLDKAIGYFNRSIAVNPTYADAYSNRGIAYALLDQYGRALDDFNKAIELNQNFAAAYYNRGKLFYKAGQEELALADFQKSCDLGSKEGCNSLHE